MRYFTLTGAAVAVMAAAAGAGLATGPAAHAATPSCGSSCVNPYVQADGHKFLMDVYRQGQATDTPVILFSRSNADPALDWTYSDEGTVSKFLADDLVSEAIALQYSGDQAWEIEYTPFGAPTGQCAGVTSAASGAKVSLQPCGVTAKTVWIGDAAAGQDGYEPAINGADTTFSHPLVLTYTGTPTALPRAQLFLAPLATYSSGTVYDSQEWAVANGVQP